MAKPLHRIYSDGPRVYNKTVMTAHMRKAPGRLFRIFPFLILILAFTQPAFAEEPALRKAPVDKDGRYYNPWAEEGGRSFLDFLKWRLSRNPWSAEKKRPYDFAVTRPDFASLNSTEGNWFVWLGHSTVLMRVNGKTIITDPVFWDVNFLVKRKTPFPIEPLLLPKIDFVLISHGHYDHLNTKTIEFLKEKHDPFFITGPGYGAYFKSLGITRHASLNWSEEYVTDSVSITSLPVQHWSKRTLSDSNRMLWCSFLIEHSGKRYYWIGDSGYFSGFRDIGLKYGPIDIVFAPIGAYEPRWFMKENHMDPEETLKTARDLNARTLVPIHWGTFDLSDEPLPQPIRKLKEAHSKNPHPDLTILPHGGSLRD